MDSGGTVVPGRLFIGGISWDTTAEGLKAYFENFGEVSDCMLAITASLVVACAIRQHNSHTAAAKPVEKESRAPSQSQAWGGFSCCPA